MTKTTLYRERFISFIPYSIGVDLIKSPIGRINLFSNGPDWASSNEPHLSVAPRACHFGCGVILHKTI